MPWTPEKRQKAWRSSGKLSFVALMVQLAYEGSCLYLDTMFSSRQILKEFPSPSGKFTAVLYTDDCGVSCDIDNVVAVVRKGDPVGDQSSSVFVSTPGLNQDLGLATNNAPKSGLPEDYWQWEYVKWLDDSHLQISFDRQAEIEHCVRRLSLGSYFWEKPDQIAIDLRPIVWHGDLQKVTPKASATSSLRKHGATSSD